MTILCTIQMLGFGAESTDLSIQMGHILNGPGVFGAHNSRWNSDNPITHDHDQRRDGLSCGGYRMNITKTYGGEGYDTPVDGNGDIAEAVFGAFHQVHHGAHDNADDEDGEQEDKNLDPTVLHRPPEFIRFPNGMRGF